LRDIVSFAMVLLGEEGELIVARPHPERWDDVSFAQQRLLISGDNGTSPGTDRQVSWRKTLQVLTPTLDIVGEYSSPSSSTGELARLSHFEHFGRHRHAIARDLAAILELARADESRPDEEASQLTLFVVASLADGPASSVLWPLAYALRERIGDLVLTEQVGLLSTGIYAEPSARRTTEASVYVALSELGSLTSGGERHIPKPFKGLRTRGSDSVRQPPFDRVYVVDREKSSGALVKDEGELTTVVGNCLKAFLASGAHGYLRDVLAPDTADLDDAGSYSSLGAASVYVPLEEMWTQARHRLTLDLLRDRFLAPVSEEAEAEVDMLAENFAAAHLELSLLSEPFLAEGPVVQYGEAEQAKRTTPAASLLRISVQVPLLTAGSETQAGEPSNGNLTTHQRFDSFERGPLADWAAQSATIADRLAEDGDAQARDSLLAAVDEQVLRMVMGHDQGSQLAGRFLAAIHEHLQHLRQSLVEIEGQGRARLRRNNGAGLGSGWSRLYGLLQSTPQWPILLGALALVSVLVAMIVLTNTPLNEDTRLAVTLGVGVVVLLVGLAARTILVRWLHARGADPAMQRQQRIDQLARVLLAGTLAQYLGAVGTGVARRQQALIDTQRELERRRDELATRLVQPSNAPHSFVRRPLLGEQIHEVTRPRPTPLPEKSVASLVFQDGSDSARFLQDAWRQAVARHPQGATAEESRPHGGLAVGEVMGLAVERYAGRLSGRSISSDIDVESLLLRSLPEHNGQEFLANLWQRAKPLIHLDDRIAITPTQVNLLVVPDAAGFAASQFSGSASALRLRLLSSHDPYAMTLVRTLHGFPLEAVANLHAYEAAFAGLPLNRQKELVLADSLIKKTRRRSRRRA
jgi:hypothetical protein